MPLVDSFGDLLGLLKDDRRAHSLAVGRKAESEARRVRPAVRAELVAAAVLHDIGYAHPESGLHALDGAKFLAGQGFRMSCATWSPTTRRAPSRRLSAGHCPQRQSLNSTDDRTKSRAGRRLVPLPAAILELLRRHRDAQEAERLTAAQVWVDEGWVFADELGQRINPRTDWSHWKQLLKDAGVRDGRLHDAWHTAATVLLLLGVHERTIMSILGWSSTAMVSRYAHVIAPIHRDVPGASTACSGPARRTRLKRESQVSTSKDVC